MRYVIFFISICVLIPLIFTGCATTNTQQIQENQQLKARIVQLESEIQKREEQKSQLETQLDDERQTKGSFEGRVQVKAKDFESPEGARKVQRALKNAGYDAGPIDGKMGKKTKDAIKDFQRDNNLTVDGLVGQQTWLKLSKYLVE
ncbi:MAG: peptidoglycan-binding protein [Candidatus Omnitrophota bacterium]